MVPCCCPLLAWTSGRADLALPLLSTPPLLCEFSLIPNTTDNHLGLFIELLGTHWLRTNAAYTCSCRRRQLTGTTSLGRCASRSPSHHLPSTFLLKMTLVFTLSLSLSLWSEVGCPSPGPVDWLALCSLVPDYTVGTLLGSSSLRRGGNHRQMPFAWGVGGGIGLEGNFLGIYPCQKANLTGGRVLCWWGTWIHTDAASPGDFLTLRFNQERWAGNNPVFPTCMNFFLFGKVVETQMFSLFSLGLLPVFSTVSFVTFSLPCCFSWQ